MAAALFVAGVLHLVAPSSTTRGSAPASPSAGTVAGSVHLGLGAPVLTAPPAHHQLVVMPQYVVDFDEDRHGPSWVTYRLDPGDHVEHAARFAGHFHVDSAVPPGLQGDRIDFERSGFDIGHLCPAADRTAQEADQAATFSFINALPQRPALNRGPWEGLEKYLRRRGRSERLYIAVGPIWGDRSATLGPHAVPIPAGFWKAAIPVCGSCGPEAVDASSEVIAAILPNDGEVGSRWMTYQTTLAEVETRSGTMLFPRLAADVKAKLRVKLEPVGKGR